MTAADRILGYTDQQVTVNSDVTADISDLKRTELGIRLNLTWHLDASAAERYLYDFEYTDEENDNLNGYAKPDYQVTEIKEQITVMTRYTLIKFKPPRKMSTLYQSLETKTAAQTASAKSLSRMCQKTQNS